MARIVQFEGRKISVPDDATDEEVAAIIEGSAGGAAPAAAPSVAPGAQAAAATPEPSIVDHIMGALDGTRGALYQTGIGASRGVANVLGLPGSLLDVLPDGATPFSNMPSGEDIQHIFGLDRAPEPRNAVEGITGRIGEEIGAGLIPTASIAARAVQKGLPAIRQSGNTIARYFMEPAAVNPAKFIGAETAAATAAGTGAGLVGQIPGVDRDTTAGQYADLAGAIGGVGAYGVSKSLLGGLKNILMAVTGNKGYTDDVVNNAVVDRLGKSAGLDESDAPMDTQTLVDAITNPGAARPSTVIPGFEESLADRTGNPGIAALEYGRQSGPNSGRFAQRRAANSDVVDAAMQGVAPQETPGAFRSALEDQVASRSAAAAANTQAAQHDFDRYIENLRPRMGAEERGADIRAGALNAERSADELQHMAWNGTAADIDPNPLADAMDTARSALPLARQDAISGVNGTLDIPRRLVEMRGGAAVPIDEINSMRTTLQDRQRAARSAGDRNEAEALGRMIDEVNNYLGSDAVPVAVRNATENARAVSRDYNERFNRPNDPIADIIADKEGRFNVPDTAVPGRFVKPDARNNSEIDRLLAETDLSSHGRPVREALSDELLSQMERAHVLGDADAIDGFLTSYGRVFDRFPDLRDEVAAAAQSNRALDTASAAQADVEASVGPKSTVGKYLQHGDADSERAITEVLNSKDPAAAADELMNTVGNDPRAVEGARAAFWQKMKTASQSSDNANRGMSGGRQWRGDWLKSFLADPKTRAVAERLYWNNPAALEKIQTFADVLDNVDLRQRGRAPGTSGTAQGVNPTLSVETLQSRSYAWMRGQVSGTFLVTSILAVFARRAVRKAQTEAIERLTDKALLEPDFAAELLRDNNPANLAALRRKAKTWFGNEASTILDLIEGNDDETEAE
jgi:hypothetical protein